MYADDNSNQLTPNGDLGNQSINCWVKGIMKWDMVGMPPPAPWPDNYNTTNLTESLLGPYCSRSVGIYKCPGDKKDAQKGPRVRSVSMNAYMGGVSSDPNIVGDGFSTYKVFRNTLLSCHQTRPTRGCSWMKMVIPSTTASSLSRWMGRIKILGVTGRPITTAAPAPFHSPTAMSKATNGGMASSQMRLYRAKALAASTPRPPTSMPAIWLGSSNTQARRSKSLPRATTGYRHKTPARVGVMIDSVPIILPKKHGCQMFAECSSSVQMKISQSNR